MPKVKALTAFTDKITGVFHQKGDLFSCEEDRAKELASLRAVEITEAEAPAKKPRAKRTAKKG